MPRLPSQPARCEIRGLVRHTVYLGRRGKPVRKLRFMPIARALELARKLQGTPGATVSVI